MRLIPVTEAFKRLSISRSEFYRRLHNDPDFPKLVRPLGADAKRVAIVESELECMS